MTARQAAAEQTRHRLLTAAMDQFSSRLYAEVTVGDIARAAGVSQGLLAHHFGNKHGAYVATLHEARRGLGTLADIEAAGPPGARLRAYWEGHFAFLAAHPALALNLILDPSGAPEAVGEFEDARREGTHDLAVFLGLDPGDPSVTMALRAFGYGIDGLAAAWLRAGQPFGVPALVEAGVQLLAGALRGLPLIDPALRVDRALRRLRPA